MQTGLEMKMKMEMERERAKERGELGRKIRMVEKEKHDEKADTKRKTQ